MRLGLLLMVSAIAMGEPLPAKKVLLVLPFESSRPVTSEILDGLEAGLRESHPTRVSVFVEFTQFVAPLKADHEKQLYDWIQYKYGEQNFDAICAVKREGLELAKKLEQRIWPGVPIVFLMEKRQFQPHLAQQRGVTGVVLDLSLEESVRTALTLFPDTRHVALIGGSAGEDRQTNASVTEVIRRVSPGIDVIPLYGMSLAGLSVRVRTLPANSIIYLGAFASGGELQQFTGATLAKALAPQANSPMFHDTTLPFGYGVVGGPMINIRRGAEEMGNLVAQVLKGTPAESLPAVNAARDNAVDWRELKRWKIPLNRLAPGTRIQFQQLTPWEAYRGPILAALGAIVLEAFLIGFLALTRSGRQRSERAARSSAELSGAILSSLTDRIAVLDENSTIVRLGENWNQAEGYPPVAIGANYLGVWRTWGSQIEARDRIITAVEDVQAGRSRTQAAIYQTSGGETGKWVEVRAERLNHAEGGTVVTHLDITQQRKAELERQRALEELHHMNRVAAVGELAGSLAHELAQPLASILSNAQAADRFVNRAGPIIEEVQEALTQIAEEDRRAHAIITRMRIILQKQPVEARECDLNHIVADVVELVRSRAGSQGVRIRVDLSESAVIVPGDAIALQQVGLNLINNSLDALREAGDMSGGSVLIKTGISGDKGELVVEDNGPGIPPEIASRVFDSFFTTRAEGMGMGLSICRSIVESHGGRISAESTLGGGARLRVSLPLLGAQGFPIRLDQGAVASPTESDAK